MSNVCYLPLEGIDDALASKLGGGFFTPYRVATLRGMYEEQSKKPLDIDNLDEAAKELAAFRNKLARGAARALKNFGTILSRAYRQLASNFTSEERFNRLNMITRAFSAVVDGYQAKNPSLSREAIIKGWHVNGELRLGENHIFEMVYNGFRAMRAKAVQEGNQEVADKITQVLNNWSALTTYARRMLKETEGVKLGNNVDYADLASETNYDGDNLAESFDASEEKREGWQEKSERRSAFGSVSKQVRKLIGSLPLFETKDGQLVPVKDDLNQPVMMDPVRVHQALMETLRGITSESQMMGAFYYIDPATGKPTSELKHPWMQPIVDALRKNPQLRTQFFVDFKKNFQPYSILWEDEKRSKGGIKFYLSKVINKVENLLEGPFNTRVSMGITVSAMSIYDSKGNIDWQKLQNVRSLIKEWLVEPKEELPGVFGETKQYKTNPSKFYTSQRDGGPSRIQQRNFLRQASEALGIEVDADTLNAIMSRPAKLRKYTRNLLEAVTFGIEGNLEEAEKKALDSDEYSVLKTRKYKSLLDAKQKPSDKIGVLREKVNRMLYVISTVREGERLESRARHYDNKGNGITLFSDVYPSYLGDKLEKIQSYVKVNDKPGLKRFIEKEFLNSSFFKDANGEVLNKWLEELIKCCNTPSSVHLADTFASQFTYEKFQGSNTGNFENFTGKQHAISLLQYYFADEQQNKNKGTTALYPVFILGDSGVQKFIRARRYGHNEFQALLDGFVNVYRQERRRMALQKAANEKLKKDGYKPIDNFSEANGFTMLPFLNKDFKASDGTVGKYAKMLSENPSRSQVEAAIKAYMSDAVAEFKQRLTALGVLETIEVVEGNEKVLKYVHLNQEADPSADAKSPRNIDRVLANYYWNTKFATIQQLQIMTIDPSFYKGTKDLQKRYKETHAPGSVVSPQARDFNGNLYSEDDTERCVYFDDIELNGESIDQEFMKAILKRFAVAEESEVDSAIKEGILTPLEDKDAEASRISKLSKLLGKNWWIYKKYQENTLTDGQGYRTLKSYRKVMGMTGKWTREMQNVYDEIESIKAKYGKGEIPMEELTKIANMAVVFQPIKPFMFTHEVYPVNDKDNLLIPVQHKYAEAVLIPELLPAGSKLRDMAYWMDEHVDSKGNPAPIDLIGSTKIVKVGCFGSTDISQASTSDDLNAALSKAYVHQLSYSDYRTQTNIPEHINSSQLFGTQVRKLVMANINMNSDRYSRYVGGQKVNLGGNHGMVNLTGRNLVSFYNSLIVANILDSFKEFNTNMSNPEKLSEMLIQATINNSRESMDNIFAYATEDGEFAMPLFEGALEHDSAALLLSLFKKLVNKQAIKGGSAVQVSAMGITGYAEDGDLKYVTDDNNNILYAECEIPWDISYKDENGNEVALKFEDYCNPDGTLKMGPDGTTPLLEVQFPGATSILAYRIPTERDYSMINLRVKRFSQKTAGGTIKVPAQGTTIASFDFDADKLYFMRKEFKAKKKQSTDEASDNLLSAIFGQDTSALIEFEEYDFTKSPLENSRAARNNMLIELIQQRLMDEETFSQRYTPGGFANASRAARVMRELLFAPLDSLKGTSRVNWARTATNSYEVSTQGDKRFSALNAKFKPGTVIDGVDVSGMTIENVYQSVVKKSGKGKAPSKESKLFTDVTPKFRSKMSFAYGNQRAEGITATTTLDAIKRGERTATTRYTSDGNIDYWKQAKIGDVIEFSGRNGEKVLVRVTRELHQLPKSTTAEEWSSKEGWDTSRFEQKVKPQIDKGEAYQMEFEYIDQSKEAMEDFSYREGYLPLWQEWARQNPELIQELREKSAGKILTDKFASTRVSQARALADILNKGAASSSIIANAEKRATDKHIQDPEPNYDPSDPMTIIAYNQQNQVAGKLIGIFANQNTHHAFCSLMEEFRLNAPISFAGHSYGDGNSSDFLHAPEGVDVDLNVAEFLSASVDAVKDPVLNFMNLNTITADAGAVLARIGYTTTEIGMLLNQPIIREVCEYCLNNNVGIDKGILEIKAKYEDAGGVWQEKVPVGPSIDELAMNIVDERKARESGDNDYVAHNATEQLAILRLFNEVSTIAGEVSKFVMSTKFTASNAIGSTFGDMYAQQMRVAAYISSVNSEKSSITMKVSDKVKLPVLMDYELTSMSDNDYMDTIIDSPFAYEQAMFDANRKALAALNRYFPYNKECYRVARALMASLTAGGTLDAATINSIHNDMMVYLMSQQELSDFNGNLPKNDTGHGPMTVREYYTEWFAKDLFIELEANPALKSMPIFKYMTFPTVENQDGTEDMSIGIQGIGGLAPYQKEELKESWAELARVNPLIARDLFLYNFHKLGFTFSPKSFMSLAPMEVKQAISMPSEENPSRTYADFLKEIMAGEDGKFHLPAEGNDFAIQYILNHPDNKKFVLDAKGKAVRDALKPFVYERGNEAVSSFTLELTNIGDPKMEKQFIVRRDKNSIHFIPAIMIDGLIYIANGSGAAFNEGNTPTSIEYVKMDRQGAKGKSLQYNSYIGNTTPAKEVEDNFVEGNSSQEADPTVPVKFNREEAISQIAGEMIAAAKKAGILAEEESGSGIIEMLKGQKDEDLQDTITAIREACRKDGIIMLDAKGNMLKGC